MKKYLLITLIALFSMTMHAQKVEYVYTEAADLTLIGKLMPGKTQNPYHRVDTTLYKGFTRRENHLVRMSWISRKSMCLSIDLCKSEQKVFNI